MKVRTVWWVVAGLVPGMWLSACVSAGEEAPKGKYVGVMSCAKLCHKTASQGKQLAIWQESKHSQAYKLLLSDEAKAAAKKAGLTTAPEKSPECLKCHVTAYNAPADQLAEGFSIEDGIQCERCHGPGENYKVKEIMKEKAKAIAAGLVIGDRKLCLECHNDKSPTWKPDRFTNKEGQKVGFDYDQCWPKIAHMRPKETE
jgi:hypothetical protein